MIYLCDKKDCKEDADLIDLLGPEDWNHLYIKRCKEHRPDTNEQIKILQARVGISL